MFNNQTIFDAKDIDLRQIQLIFSVSPEFLQNAE